MSGLTLHRPWLDFDLGAEMQVLSWAVNRPGLVRARRILWREVRNADLPPGLDVDAWLARELAERGAAEAVALLTSRDIGCFTEARAAVGGVEAHAVATVGLSNAERVGHRVDRRGQGWGTINMALRQNSDSGDPSANFEPERAGGDALPRALRGMVDQFEAQVTLSQMSRGSGKPTLSIS